MDDRVTQLTSEVARSLKNRLPQLIKDVNDRLCDAIPEFNNTEMRRLMDASTEANLNSIFDTLLLGIRQDDITTPPAAAHYARRFAQHDLTLQALLRAYRLGGHTVEQWAIDEIRAWDLSAAEALSTTQRIAQLINGYAEQVVNELVNVYTSERRAWGERSEAAQVARIHAVLDTDTLETAAAEELLGVPLRGWHVAAVAWTDSPEPLRGLRPLLTEISSVPTLTVRVDAGTTWAWLRFTTPPTMDKALLATRLAEHPGLRVALGEPGMGLNGFRVSHQESLRVRKVAEFDTTTGRQLFDHADLALAGLLVDRRDEVRTWVHRTLGELAGPDDSMARLRDTLRVFFETNGSYNDTATRMHMHKNTVFKRVRKAEEILAQPIADKRRTLEIAVLLCDQLALAGGDHS